MIPTKVCCRCKLAQIIEDFPNANRGMYGVHSICKECKKVYMLNYAIAGKLKISKDKYRASDKGKSKIKQYTASDINKNIQREYRRSAEGRVLCTAKLAKYRAVQKSAVPSWISKEDLKKVYRNCPESMEVDHIIPLQNKLVCGLHVPWNLQYLTRHENSLKSNYFDGTYNNISWRIRVT